jgi:hypothetical protein
MAPDVCCDPCATSDHGLPGPTGDSSIGSATVPDVSSQANAAERRLVLVIGAVVFVDTMFYAAIRTALADARA